MENIVVIGSVALSVIYLTRQPKDIDLIMTFETYKKWIKQAKDVQQCYPINKGKKIIVKTLLNIYEIELAWSGSTAESLMAIVEKDNFMQENLITEDFKNFRFFIPKLDVLYELKMSHRFLKDSPHFKKTMTDIRLMRKNGAIIKHPEWLSQREKETYNYSHPSLNSTKNEFFKNETFYKYDHDDIHLAVKLLDKPAYQYIMEDNVQVKCDEDKFNNADLKIKMACALEESYVLALERSLIPNDFKPDPKKAFDMAIMKVCTSITSGWFREWCWEHYDDIVSNYDDIYLDRFLWALDTGKIRPFKSDKY